ncbi:MAG: hypothetical protein JWQ43_2323 [Glaciihabitans sp.]|nr:hypothetical protein [Glaciihabitans sp.]
MAKVTSAVLIRPKHEMTRTAWLTFFVTVIPLFGVLYWYTAPLGVWPQVLAAQVALAVACVFVDVRQRMVFTSVSDTAIEGNGIFSPRQSVPLDSVQSVALVNVYTTVPNEFSTQMVVLDTAGRCVFRMRGHFWHTADVEAVCAAIGRPVIEPPTHLSEAEFFEAYPGSRYWFERSTPVRIALIAGTTVLVGLAVIVLVYSAGIPLSF